MHDFLETPIGPVPRVPTRLNGRDLLGTVGARIGIVRGRYRVAPGLYAVGAPGPDAPVLVTANYKLSFDALRGQLGDVNAWLMVIDTRGINVWCAAGKGTFSTAEVIHAVHRYRLAEVVRHRDLILPQLAAAGVAAREIRRGCGFGVLFGPIRAADLPAYLSNGNRCDEAMREVTFTLRERAVLIPVELYLTAKPLGVIMALALILSGLGPSFFSPADAVTRGFILLEATLAGILGGAVLAPLLLPWLPFRQFWLKGVLSGLAVVACASPLLVRFNWAEAAAMSLWLLTVSSYLAMNFTGSTPYTSPSGVEYEMKRAIPAQLTAVCLACGLWVGGRFF